jgi:LysM repeat protein
MALKWPAQLDEGKIRGRMEQRLDQGLAHVDQPAFEQMQIDQNISRVALFFVCFLTLGVFYFTLVTFPISKLLPINQLQQVGQAVNALNPSPSRLPAASNKPTGALGGSQISASAVPSISSAPAPSTAGPAAAPSAASSPSAKPAASASASAAPLNGGSYTVQAGDTLLAIARKYNTTVQAIADANKMTAGATLRVGQTLIIPKS